MSPSHIGENENMGASKAWIAAAIAAFAVGAAAEARPPAPVRAAAGAVKRKPVDSAVQHADLKRAKEAKPRKPAVTAKAASKKAVTARAANRRGTLTAKKPSGKKATATAKAPLRTTTITARREPEKRYLPPPVSMNWTPPPLGPERFYPNGIPALHPAFMHPLPGEQPAQTAAVMGASSGESELRN